MQMARSTYYFELSKADQVAVRNHCLADEIKDIFSQHKGRYGVRRVYQELIKRGHKVNVPFPVSWTVKMKKKQKETQDILSYHSQAAGCSDKARAKASGGRQPIEECGRTGL